MPASKKDVPTFEQLINPILRALHRLGGSASIRELIDAVVGDLGVSEELAGIPHSRGTWTELGYRSAWARNYLKNFGLIENSERGVWALTAKGRETQSVDSRQLVRAVQQQHRESRDRRSETPEGESGDAGQTNGEGSEGTWQARLLDTLYRITPEAFERLCQRLLREAGFIEVAVAGRSGDGGIDGHGTIRLGGFVSFNVLFQSKRYRGNIGPDIVREFRGAMTGRADKGLIITTGGFTRDARKEATRDGAPPIDLIDGESLVEKLKEFRLGIQVRQVESVEVNDAWYKSL